MSTKLKTVGGTQIYVRDDGKFTATVNGKLRAMASLSGLEKVIMEYAIGKTVHIVGLENNHAGSTRVAKTYEVISYLGAGKSRYGSEQIRVKGGLFSTGETVEIKMPYPAFEYDPETDKQWQKMVERHNAAEKDMKDRHRAEEAELTKLLKPVNSKRLLEMLAEANAPEPEKE